MVCSVICACSNTSAHCVVLSSAAAIGPVIFFPMLTGPEWQMSVAVLPTVGQMHFLRQIPPETLLSCSATGCLKTPHSFLLQASSPPASGLIVRVYSLNVLSNTLSTYQGLQTIRGCQLDKNKLKISLVWHFKHLIISKVLEIMISISVKYDFV